MPALKPFASTLPISIESNVAWTKDLLHFSFHVSGDVASVKNPLADRPQRRDELWGHTCFEAFIQPLSGESYLEFNFAPSGDWNVYHFDRYREGMRVEPRVQSLREFSFRSSGYDAWLECAVDASSLQLKASGFRLGLSAVIESTRGEKSYWALHHPGDKPDFHDGKGFQLELAAPAIRN